MNEIFRKVPPAQSKSNFGGPAGGSALERASPPLAGEKSREEVYMIWKGKRRGGTHEMGQSTPSNGQWVMVGEGLQLKNM